MDLKRNISVLGSTGSIGTSCMDVVRAFPGRFTVTALAAGRNTDLLARQVQEFRPRLVVVLEEALAVEMEERLKCCDPPVAAEVAWGEAGYEKAAVMDGTEMVVSALVGAAGLKPTWAAVKAGKMVALANKETMVMAGELIMAEAKRRGAVILPVDSEHSAIFQAMAGHRSGDVKRVILTASGGPFRQWRREDLHGVTSADALAHPNWSMGAKISIDSATLMNKGLEAIEARWLFGLPWDRIAIHVHPQSIVHSLVEFVDGSVLAQLGVPDMRVPIAYALSYPERLPLNMTGLDLPRTGPLTFEEPDLEKFPCLAMALEAGRRGGVAPAVMNAANEAAVQAFLDGHLAFLEIGTVVAGVLDVVGNGAAADLDQIMRADAAARVKSVELIEKMTGEQAKC